MYFWFEVLRYIILFLIGINVFKFFLNKIVFFVLINVMFFKVLSDCLLGVFVTVVFVLVRSFLKMLFLLF